MTQRFALLSLLAVCFSSVGCTTAIKQAYYGVTGAKGEYYELSIVNEAELADYRACKVEPFTNALGEHVPQEVIDQVNIQLPVVLNEAYLFYPEGKRLRITGVIKHYTGESGLKGSISAVFGSEVCVCEVKLLDDESGALVGQGMCWGEVKSAVRRGPKEFGVGVGKGVTDWIRDRLGEEETEKRNAELEPKDE